LFLSGKAEAGSAGEQPARNNLIDWNGQKGWGRMTSTFFISPHHSKSRCLKKLNTPFELQKTCFYQQYQFWSAFQY